MGRCGIHTTKFITKACLLAGFVLLSISVYAQDMRLADSLEAVYHTGKFEEENRLELLYSIIVNHPVPKKKLEYSEILLEAADEMHSEAYRFNAFLQKGNALTLKGDLPQALDSFFRCLEIAQSNNNPSDLARSYTAIAGVYSSMGNNESSIDYYKRAIAISISVDSLTYATTMANLGDEYILKMQQPDSALILLNKSNEIFQALDFQIGMAYNLGNMGLAYIQKGNPGNAERNLIQAITILEQLGDHYPIAVFLLHLSDIHADQDQWDVALTYAGRSLELAKQYGLKEQMSDAYLKLSELYESIGDKDASLLNFKNHVAVRDSVNNLQSVQEMAELRTNYEIAQKQVEVDLLNQQRKTQRIIVFAVIGGMLSIALLAFGLYRRNIHIKATNRIIEQEMDKSDNLLKNILPEMTARELKISGRVQAKKFPSVTVMFTDFKGFTLHSEKLTPEILVDTVDYYFSKFDSIILKYGLEKIKTMGDAYMCAGGLPYPVEDHACKVVEAAFEIVDFVERAKASAGDSEVRFDVRIGANTGTVVAGVVGTNKFAYDIWGDTVNIAARMESNSAPGRINVSENTYQLIKNKYDCEYRGKIAVKNKGMMNMYFVNKANG